MALYTYQDFIAMQSKDKANAVKNIIQAHRADPMTKMAIRADLYDHQQNETIMKFLRLLFNSNGMQIEDPTASNNRVPSNFFRRLNTQRCTYLLGNGVSFTDHKEQRTDADGKITTIDLTKEYFGESFDEAVKRAGYKALIHGISFGFWNMDRLHVFTLPEFAPIWDEITGEMRAGVRYWQLRPDKPCVAVLYEEDGYERYQTDGGNSLAFRLVEPKKAYKTIYKYTPAGGDEVIGAENYGSLPIVPYWGSDLHQSTLVGMQPKIDAYDLVSSGFANDLTDCAEIYWIVNNAVGMNDRDLGRFRDRLKFLHIAAVDSADNVSATPYEQQIPFESRETFLKRIKSDMYEDFGALDVHTVAAGATNDHIDAAYQPMDEEADNFEFETTRFIKQILALNGIEDEPVYKRNRISNQKEQVEMIMMEATYLDEETVLQKLPNVTVDEVQQILAKRDKEDRDRMTQGGRNSNQTDEDEEEEPEEPQTEVS